MKRRSFIQHVGHSLAIPGLVSSFGFSNSPSAITRLMQVAQETDRVLVLIYLSGGNDGLNTVVPLDQFSRYSNLRQEVFLPENSLHNLENTEVGLHSSLPFLKSLFEEDRLSIVQSVGYSNQNFSHFRSTDIWMSGSSATDYLNSGWAGRYLNHEFPEYPNGFPNNDFSDPLAIEIGRGGSLLFQGPTAAMSMTISNPENFYRLLSSDPGSIPDTLAGEKLEYIRLIAQQSQQYGEVVKAASEKIKKQFEYPRNNLANQLKIVSRLIAGGLKTPVYMVNIGGFDTHANQVDSADHTKGNHANLLARINESVQAFMSDLELLGTSDRVLGMTFSEFGRRIVSNASMGTDHGAAAPMFLFGNKVNGGVFGSNPKLPSSKSSSDNLQQQYDFRQVYGSVLEQWFGLVKEDVDSIILENVDTLPLIEDPAFIGIQSNIDKMSVFPNPLGNLTRIAFESNGEPVEVDIFDRAGRKMQNVYSGTPDKGKRMIEWNTSFLPLGLYLVHIRGASISFSKQVIKR